VTLQTLLSRILYLIGKGCLLIAKHIYIAPHERRVATWFENRGDKTLRLDYDLDGNSLVFDLGGYEGQWASDIFAMYCCSIYVFEPVEVFAQNITKRFSKNPKVQVHPFGLASADQVISIGLNSDGSSIYKSSPKSVSGRLVQAADFLGSRNIQAIDLMKINIEGGEYDLLEYLIDSGVVAKIKNIQVQFHDFVPDAEIRMHHIQEALTRTHRLTYQYPFVWENWQLKI